MTSGRSVVFSNTTEILFSGIKHQNPNPCLVYSYTIKPCYFKLGPTGSLPVMKDCLYVGRQGVTQLSIESYSTPVLFLRSLRRWN
jgi:hypothetical protein